MDVERKTIDSSMKGDPSFPVCQYNNDISDSSSSLLGKQPVDIGQVDTLPAALSGNFPVGTRRNIVSGTEGKSIADRTKHNEFYNSIITYVVKLMSQAIVYP